jgi:succinate dehydrogenase / fumarate reductase, membrane anchor subunit
MAETHTRSPFVRAIGLGSAKEGVETWWRERITAVALIPLTLWFVGSLIAESDSDYTGFVSWLKAPVTTFLTVLMLIGAFWHTALGLQVIIEDYVHSAAKIPALALVRLACFALPVAGILAVLRIAFLS